MKAEHETVLSVVIPSWNTRDLLRTCLRYLAAADKPRTEVIVVENGSEDGSGDMVADEFPDVVLVRNAQNEGFARGCNQGMRLARGRFVLLLNTDTEVAPDAIRRMLDFLAGHPEHGAVAPRLVHPDGRTQRTLQAFPGWWTPLFFATPFERWFPNSFELRRYFLRDWSQEDSRDIDQPPAACLLVRREVLDQIGLFDERLWLFYNDVDLSKRIGAAGWKTHYLAEARVVHHVGASTGKFEGFVPEWNRNRLLYYRKHHGRVAGWWVKLCVGFAFVDFALRSKEPVRPVLREYLRFLAL